MRFALPLSLMLILSACDGQATDPSGITPGEAEALNDAAEMLDGNIGVPNADPETPKVPPPAETPVRSR